MNAHPHPRRRMAAPLAALLLLAVHAGGGALHAQPTREDPVDLQGWAGARLAIDLPRQWVTTVEYQVRSQDNASAWRGSYLTAGAEKGMGKHWTLEGNVRLARVEARTYERIAGGAAWDASMRGVKVSVRTLAQFQRQNFAGNDETSSDTDTFIRTRLQLRRPLTRWLRGYLSTEPFLAPGADYLVDNWRNTVGTEWDLGKGRALDLYYLYRPDYGKRSYNRTFHVIGAQLELEWKPRRRTAR